MGEGGALHEVCEDLGVAPEFGAEAGVGDADVEVEGVVAEGVAHVGDEGVEMGGDEVAADGGVDGEYPAAIGGGFGD